VGEKTKERTIILLALAFISVLVCAAPGQSWAQSVPSLGIFENHADVGVVLHPGSVVYDASEQNYTVTGSGSNMWFAADAFQFVWKKVSGDAILTADIAFANTSGNPHKKAALIIRQSLDPDSVYADVAVHGNGLTALQFRDEKGVNTQEVQSNVSAPRRVRIAKRGDYVYISVATDAGSGPQVAGGWLRVPIQGDFYVGIGVCAHDQDAEEKAIFSNVDLLTPPASTAKPTLYSALEAVPVGSGDRRVVYIAPEHFEAPNWTRDGTSFIFNRDGRLLRLPVKGGTPETIDTGFATRCNNDHGISPDGTQLAISDQSQEAHHSLVYIVPLVGGTPRRITKNSPSYWHGWSPDGKTLAFVGQRDGDFDIYTLPVAGGPAVGTEETRLTTAKGLDDGPEYSPDGNYIYFNSERSGIMQIWRMRADGSQQEQLISDDFNNWFPHISPDGEWMVFLSYDKTVNGHPENKDVALRLMSLADKKVTVLAKLFGGQGTINVPSWSPDSKQVAFVSYQLIPEEDVARK
jgi:TolB protein